MNANSQARLTAAARNNHPPHENRKERIWKQAYRRHMVTLGCTVSNAVGMDPEVDLTRDPEACANANILSRKDPT